MKKPLCFSALLIAHSIVVAQANYSIQAEDAAGLWGQADGTGAGNDIVRAAFAAAGDTVNFQVVPYNRCKWTVMAGHSLACFGMGRSDELKGKVTFPKHSIYTNTSTIFVRKADAAKFKRIEDLRPHTEIGTVRGYEYPAVFEQLINSGVLSPIQANSEVQILKMLAVGRFDLAVGNLDDLKNADYLLKQAGVADTVQVAFPLAPAGTFLGFAVHHPETPAAMQSFDHGMAAIKANGTLAKILKKWKAKL